MASTGKRTARVPVLGENGRISDDYTPQAIVDSTQAAEQAATAAAGSASAAAQSASEASSAAQSVSQDVESAKQSADSAQQSATRADESASAADASAILAGEKADAVLDHYIESATATTLEPGSQATASVADKVLSIGVPRGEKGDKGDTGLGVPDGGDPGEILAKADDGAAWETAKQLGLASDSDVQLIKGGIYHEQTELKYLTPVGDFIIGWFYDANGEYKTGQNIYCAKFVVDGFSSIESYNYAGGVIPLAVFFDSSDRFISSYTPSYGWTSQYLTIDVPEGAAYFYGQAGDEKQAPPSERIKVRANVTSTDWSYSVRDHIDAIEQRIDSEQAKFEIEQLNRRVSRDERANDFDYKEFDKTYYVFTIDDANPHLPDMYDLFHELGVPLSASIITSNLDEDWKGDGRTVKDICNLIVADGGEILSHSGNPITPDSTEEDYIEVFRDTKMTLEAAGFTVRGIITAGGSNYLWNDARLDNWSRRYYDYSDQNGLSSSKQYWNPRVWFGDLKTIDAVKEQVDSQVAGKRFIVAAMHGSDDPSSMEYVDNVRQIVEYIKGKGDAAEITTWAHVYDTFGTTRLDKRIDAIAGAVE